MGLVPSGKLTVCELENHHAIHGKIMEHPRTKSPFSIAFTVSFPGRVPPIHRINPCCQFYRASPRSPEGPREALTSKNTGDSEF